MYVQQLITTSILKLKYDEIGNTLIVKMTFGKEKKSKYFSLKY